MPRLKDKLTYANVMATIAVFIALGGGAYAVSVGKNSVTSKSVKNNSLKGVDVKKDALTGDDVSEAALVQTCPAGTLLAGGTCVESTARANAGLEAAMDACAAAGMRLPTPSEYRTLTQLSGIAISGTGEQTTVFDTDGGLTHAIATENGLSVSSNTGFPRPFRCATTPNG